MGDSSDKATKAVNIMQAVAMAVPLIEALVELAEKGSNASGEQKSAAVMEATGAIYESIRRTGTVREIKDVPFASIAPIVANAGGLIASIVGIFNRIGRFAKSLVS